MAAMAMARAEWRTLRVAALSRLMPIWDLLLLYITQPTTAMPKVNSPFNLTSRREYRLAHPCIFFLYLDRKLAISRITYLRVWPHREHRGHQFDFVAQSILY